MTNRALNSATPEMKTAPCEAESYLECHPSRVQSNPCTGSGSLRDRTPVGAYAPASQSTYPTRGSFFLRRKIVKGNFHFLHSTPSERHWKRLIEKLCRATKVCAFNQPHLSQFGHG